MNRPPLILCAALLASGCASLRSHAPTVAYADLMTPVDPACMTKAGERARIEASYAVLNIPAREQAEINEALNSTNWNWYVDSDGCTAVSPVYWPTKYFPPCLRHDFDWFTGHGGDESNLRFYRIQRAYNMRRTESSVRYVGVEIAWWTWFKWRDMIWGAPGTRK